MRLYRLMLALLLGLWPLAPHATERVTFYHNDALGSPIAATDQDGRVLWRKSYAPYGQELNREASNEPGYTGKLLEPGLGIQNFGARWYDPRIGRFLAIDPAGFDPQNPQSFNRYAYANNNPYRYLDPDGNSPLDVGFFIADTVSFGLAVASRNPAAIQSAAFDLAASAVGLASPIPGTGLAIKAARAADKVGDVANIPGKLYHYTSSKYADTIVENGLKPGISSKKVFTTPDGTKSGLQAQIDLALPPNRGVPDALLEIDTRTLNQMGVKVPGATPVRRDFNMPGGGQEVTFDTLIPPEAIKRVR